MNASIFTLNAHEFDVFIDKGKPVVVEFYADWCVHCRGVAPAFEKMSEKYKGKVIFAKVNTDRAPNLVIRYEILAIPQFLIFLHGQITSRVHGPYIEKLERLIERSLQEMNS